MVCKFKNFRLALKMYKKFCAVTLFVGVKGYKFF